MKKFILSLVVLSSLFFSNCESNDDENIELTIQEKVAILENGEWLLMGFEDRVMHTYKEGKQFTYYGTDSVFSDEAIPGTESFTIEGDKLTFDFNFGNLKTFEINVSCNNTIIEFYDNGELNKTLYKQDSNYMSCL